jgi:hypothetical protein
MNKHTKVINRISEVQFQLAVVWAFRCSIFIGAQAGLQAQFGGGLDPQIFLNILASNAIIVFAFFYVRFWRES